MSPEVMPSWQPVAPVKYWARHAVSYVAAVGSGIWGAWPGGRRLVGLLSARTRLVLGHRDGATVSPRNACGSGVSREFRTGWAVWRSDAARPSRAARAAGSSPESAGFLARTARFPTWSRSVAGLGLSQ